MKKLRRSQTKAGLKKIAPLMLLLMLISLMTGCGGYKNPVKNCCKAIQDFDEVEVAEILDKDWVTEEVSSEFKEDCEYYYNFLKKQNKKIKYKITEIDKKESGTWVKVEFKYVDASEAFDDALERTQKYLVKTERQLSDSEIIDLSAEYFDDSLKDIGTEMEEIIIDFHCVKEDGKWEIDDVNSLYNLKKVLYCNMGLY